MPINVETDCVLDWSKHGGFVTRDVLIDYHRWATLRGINRPANERSEIHIRDIEEIVREQKVVFRPGDILMIRSGWTDWYNRTTEDERYKGATIGHDFIGLDGTEESVTWLWNHHFAAVAGDAIAFEAWPPKAPWCMLSSLIPVETALSNEI
jgi:kynurenine formamidase